MPVAVIGHIKNLRFKKTKHAIYREVNGDEAADQPSEKKIR